MCLMGFWGLVDADNFGFDSYAGLPDEAWTSADGNMWELRGGGFAGRDGLRGICRSGINIWLIGGVAASGPRSDIWIS